MLFIFTLITKVSSNCGGLRTTLLIMLNYDPIEYPNKNNYIMTFFSLVITTFIASTFQNISDYISLIGYHFLVFSLQWFILKIMIKLLLISKIF